MITTINEYKKQIINDDLLKNDLIKLVNQCNDAKEFTKIVTYYGIKKKKFVNVNDLINTEKVNLNFKSVTKASIRVTEDIKSGRLYIIEGHHRVAEAKQRGEQQIEAFVTRGNANKKGELDPETSIYFEENNINPSSFYKKYKIFKESLQHNKELHRNTSQQWLINLLTNGKIQTENKNYISLSQNESGGDNDFGNCHIVFDEKIIYDQGAIEVDYYDDNFWLTFPDITKHVTGYFNEKDYYKAHDFVDDDAIDNNELDWVMYCGSFDDEEEVVIKQIIYQPKLIKHVIITYEEIDIELKKLLIKYKIKYKN